MNIVRTISALTLVSLGTFCVVGCGADQGPNEPKAGTASHLEGDGESDDTGLGDTSQGDTYAGEGSPEGDLTQASNDAAEGDGAEGDDAERDAAEGDDPNASSDPDRVAAGPATPIIVGVIVVACVTIPHTCPAYARYSCGAQGVKSAKGQCNIGLTNAGISCEYECNTPTQTG
jgi:hypothetical protein